MTADRSARNDHRGFWVASAGGLVILTTLFGLTWVDRSIAYLAGCVMIGAGGLMSVLEDLLDELRERR